jgi:hypothetical protein
MLFESAAFVKSRVVDEPVNNVAGRIATYPIIQLKQVLLFMQLLHPVEQGTQVDVELK